MQKQKLLLFILFFGATLLLSSCKGMKVRHGKDCGCGSFSQQELIQDRQQ